MTTINKKIIFFIILLVLFQAGLFFLFVSKKIDESEKNVKSAEVEKAGEKLIVDKEKARGGILPHHLAVRGKIEEYLKIISQDKYKRVILLCPNHLDYGPKNIITSDREWKTDNGELTVDQDFVEQLSKGGIEKINDPFFNEPSINVLAPLIKKYFPDSFFVPIIIKTSATENEIAQAVKNITALSDDDTLFLASVDFSHYQPAHVGEFHDLKTRVDISNFNFEAIKNDEVDSPTALIFLLRYLEAVKAQKGQLYFSTNTGYLSGNLDVPSTTHNFYAFYAGEKTEKKVASFLWFGDMMLDRHIRERYGKDYSELLGRLRGDEGRFLRGVDLIGANLEGAVIKDGEHYPPILANDFSSSPASLKTFQDNNFNFFNLANNHVTDQNSSGYEETKKNLDSSALNYSGCPDGAVGDCSLKIMPVNNLSVGLVGLSMVYRALDQEKIKEVLSNAKAESDFVVVNIHWGNEYKHEAAVKQTELAHLLVDNGADLVIGHHPHVLQGIEKYKDKLIFYSLGNFIFDQYFSQDTQEGIGVGINYNEGDIKAFIFPLNSKLGVPSLVSGDKKIKILENISDWSIGSDDFKNEIRSGVIKMGN